MSKDRKTELTFYAAWDYRREIADLNARSQQGWQLLKGGCYFSTFRRDDSVQYRYQLDYPGRLEDPGRYLETFEEQGWEFVNSTFNGWYYFRKRYDPSLPPEQYEIFTDRASLEAMTRRWSLLGRFLLVMILALTAMELILFVSEPDLSNLIMLFPYPVFAAAIIKGLGSIRRKEAGRGRSWFFVLAVAVMLACPISSMIVDGQRAEVSASLTEPLPEGDGVWLEFSVSIPDLYSAGMVILSKDQAELSLVGPDGQILLSAAGEQQLSKRLLLMPGEYRLLVSSQLEAEFRASFSLN